MAVPSTSVKSVAMTATSAAAHRPRLTARGYSARHADARCCRDAMPSRAESVWRRMANTLDAPSTQRRV